MSDDDVQTLLSRATPRRANGDPIENEMSSVNSDVLLAAFDEIERLRAHIVGLEKVLSEERLAAHDDAEDIKRLRARVEVLRDALSGTHTWLGAALKCPAFQWDADQKQAAQHDYDEARAALKEAKP